MACSVRSWCSTSARVDDTNATYRQVASERANVAVADWHAIVTDRPELLHDDRTHPNMAGISVYADLIAQTAERLGSG